MDRDNSVAMQVLIGILVKRGLISKAEAKAVKGINALTRLLQAASVIPPVSKEERKILDVFESLNDSRDLEDKIARLEALNVDESTGVGAIVHDVVTILKKLGG